jgi:hypothetical protein
MTDWIQKAAEEIAATQGCVYSGCDCRQRNVVQFAAIIQRHAPASTPEPPAPPEEG